MIMNQNLVPLGELFQKAIFIWMKRDPVYNIHSALLARQRQYGNFETWYSFRIKEFPMLNDLDPLHSVAGQIAATHLAIEKARMTIPPEKWLNIPYENFCDAPAHYYKKISRSVLDQDGASTIPPYSGVKNFQNSNVWKITDYSKLEAERAYETMYADIKTSQSLE
jgi:hypothetical protein